MLYLGCTMLKVDFLIYSQLFTYIASYIAVKSKQTRITKELKFKKRFIASIDVLPSKKTVHI